jgi:hypothetical protein
MSARRRTSLRTATNSEASEEDKYSARRHAELESATSTPVDEAARARHEARIKGEWADLEKERKRKERELAKAARDHAAKERKHAKRREANAKVNKKLHAVGLVAVKARTRPHSSDEEEGRQLPQQDSPRLQREDINNLISEIELPEEIIEELRQGQINLGNTQYSIVSRKFASALHDGKPLEGHEAAAAGSSAVTAVAGAETEEDLDAVIAAAQKKKAELARKKRPLSPTAAAAASGSAARKQRVDEKEEEEEADPPLRPKWRRDLYDKALPNHLRFIDDERRRTSGLLSAPLRPEHIVEVQVALRKKIRELGEDGHPKYVGSVLDRGFDKFHSTINYPPPPPPGFEGAATAVTPAE